MLSPCSTSASPPSRRARAKARSSSSWCASPTCAPRLHGDHGPRRIAALGEAARRRAPGIRTGRGRRSPPARARRSAHAGQAARGLRFAQVAVDAVGGGLHRQFAQRGQVARREERLQRLRGLLGHVDLALLQALDQLARRQVDQHDVAQAVEHDVGHGLADAHAGDAVHDVVEAFQVLDVDRGVDVDAGVEQFDHVLPAALVAAAGDVAMREFVDQRDRGLAREQRVEVEFLQRAGRW